MRSPRRICQIVCLCVSFELCAPLLKSTKLLNSQLLDLSSLSRCNLWSMAMTFTTIPAVIVGLTTPHPRPGLQHLLSRLKALCEYDAVPKTPIKSRRRKWLQRHIKWKKSSAHLVGRYEARAHRKAANRAVDAESAPPTQPIAAAAATVADITPQPL